MSRFDPEKIFFMAAAISGAMIALALGIGVFFAVLHGLCTLWGVL